MNSSVREQEPAGGPLGLSLGIPPPKSLGHQQTKPGLPPEVRYSGQGEHVSGFGFGFGFGKYPSPVRVRPVYIPKIEKEKNTEINFGWPPRSDFEKKPDFDSSRPSHITSQVPTTESTGKSTGSTRRSHWSMPIYGRLELGTCYLLEPCGHGTWLR